MKKGKEFSFPYIVISSYHVHFVQPKNNKLCSVKGLNPNHFTFRVSCERQVVIVIHFMMSGDIYFLF